MTRGTKRRGGNTEQERRACMVSDEHTVHAIGLFFKHAETPQQRNLLLRVFGRPALDQMIRERDA